MDKVYKSDIPEMIQTLRQFKSDFSRIESKTDWANLRIAPLLKHAKTLQKIIESPKFAKETARLTRGVRMFRSDLVYLRTNIAALRDVLMSMPTTAAQERQTRKR